jgi:HEAT repeat protein
VESLVEEDPTHAHLVVKALAPLLENGRALVRGDAAWLLGVVGRREALAGLRRLLDDRDQGVREAAAEAVEGIEGRED